MKEVFLDILRNTSLWEVMALVGILIILFVPKFRNRITRLKFGDFEVELARLKEEVQKGSEKIDELTSEIESEQRQFDELLESFDANAPISELATTRQAIKSQAKNLDEVAVLKQYLNTSATHEQLYLAAVGIREKRPVALFPDVIELLGDLASDKKLGGYRLNTIWTLTSAVHNILISAVRDGVPPFPNAMELEQAEIVLNALQNNKRVRGDRPDNPMKGIRGPIKYSLNWIKKAHDKLKQRG